MIKNNMNNSRLCKPALHLISTGNMMVIFHLSFFVTLYSNIEGARSNMFDSVRLKPLWAILLSPNLSVWAFFYFLLPKKLTKQKVD